MSYPESSTIFRSSFASRPNIGLPSDLKFPILSSSEFIFAAVLKSGAYIRLCIFLTLLFLLYILLTSADRKKRTSALQETGTSLILDS